MKSIVTGILFTLSLVGIGFCIYHKNWMAFFTNVSFTIQFGYLFYNAYFSLIDELVKLRKENDELLEENEKLRYQNLKLRKLLAKREDRS